jgi:hypothetical protein
MSNEDLAPNHFVGYNFLGFLPDRSIIIIQHQAEEKEASK